MDPTLQPPPLYHHLIKKHWSFYLYDHHVNTTIWFSLLWPNSGHINLKMFQRFPQTITLKQLLNYNLFLKFNIAVCPLIRNINFALTEFFLAMQKICEGLQMDCTEHLPVNWQKICIIMTRAAKKVLSSRLIMNSRWLWNSHQRHKFRRAEALGTFWKLESRQSPFPGFSRGLYSTADAMLFWRNTGKTGNNAVDMSQVFHDIARFERFTDLNLFKCVVNVVIQTWEMELIFCSQLR